MILLHRFHNLWRQIAPYADPTGHYHALLARYSEPQRYYHNISHIEAMLVELDQFTSGCRYPSEPTQLKVIQMAIWYHDAVYDTHAKDNEEKSAGLFREVAAHTALPQPFTQDVCAAIIATKHSAPPPDNNSAILCDADLAILGQPEAAFDNYETRIRLEYGWVPEKQFHEGRAEVLRSFLARESIFNTPFFRERYEQQARRNLSRSLHRLGVS